MPHGIWKIMTYKKTSAAAVPKINELYLLLQRYTFPPT
jgi:hypothetical protein